MSINIWTDSMQHAALLGKPVLFTNWLIQRDIIPDGWYCYKALLSVVDHPSLQDATRLMGEIDQYELRPEVAQTWGYAEMMFREKYSALPEELFQTPQAAQIGQKMLDDRLGVITEYGLIRRKDGQPLPVFQPEQEIGQGLEMM